MPCQQYLWSSPPKKRQLHWLVLPLSGSCLPLSSSIFCLPQHLSYFPFEIIHTGVIQALAGGRVNKGYTQVRHMPLRLRENSTEKKLNAFRYFSSFCTKLIFKKLYMYNFIMYLITLNLPSSLVPPLSLSNPFPPKSFLSVHVSFVLWPTEFHQLHPLVYLSMHVGLPTRAWGTH